MRPLTRWVCRVLALLLVAAGWQIVTLPAKAAAPASLSATAPKGHAQMPPAPSARDIHGDVPKRLPVDPTHDALPANSPEAKRIAHDRRHLDPFVTKPAPRLPMPASLSTARAEIRALSKSGQLTPAGVALQETSPAASPLVTPDAAAAKACTTDPLCAAYTPAAPNPIPSYLAAGAEKVTIKNTGTKDWPAGRMTLGYHLEVSVSGAWKDELDQKVVAIPALASGASYTVAAARIEPLLPGSYEVVWDLYKATGWLKDLPANDPNQVPVPAAQPVLLNIAHTAPWGGITSPAVSGGTINNLSPSLTAVIHDDGTKAFYVEMEVCAHGDGPSGSTCHNSTTLSTAMTSSGTAEYPDGTRTVVFTDTWVPSGLLSWDTEYDLFVRFLDGPSWLNWSAALTFTTVVTQPAQVQLGSNPAYLDPQGVNMYLGQYAKSQQDLTLPSTPEPFTITRTYNSADTSDRAFGVGWSSILDAKWTENAAKSLITLTMPDGSQRNYAKNPDGTWAGGWGFPVPTNVNETLRRITIDGTTYTFASSGQLNLVQYGPRQIETLFLDASGEAYEIEDSTGRSIYLTWSSGHVTSESTGDDETGHVWTFGYDTNGTLTQVCNPASLDACEQYGYVNGVTGPHLASDGTSGSQNNLTIQYTDVLAATVKSISSPDGSWTYAYPSLYPLAPPTLKREVVATDPGGTPHYYAYGADGELLEQWTNSATPQTAHEIEYGYDVTGQVAFEIDQNRVENDYFYDNSVGGLTGTGGFQDSNRPWATSITRYQRPPNNLAGDPRVGLPLSSRDANGHTTTYAYDDEGELIEQDAPTGHGGIASTTYDYACENGAMSPPVVDDPSAQGRPLMPCGVLLDSTDPQGLVTTYGYDRFGDETREEDPSGKVTESVYDEYGNMVKQTVSTPQNPSGVTTEMSYDAVGHLTHQAGPVVTNPVTGVPHQLEETYGYSADGVLTSAAEADLSNGSVLSRRSTTYGLDDRDRIATVTDNGVVTGRNVYNWNGQPTQTWDGDGNEQDYIYTGTGQLLRETQTSADGTTSVVQANAYDGGGRLASSSDPMGRITYYTYTPNDLVKTVYMTTTSGAPAGSPRTITLHNYTYDSDGNILGDSASSSPVG
jgi:YD repeat-containing protein